MPRSSWSAKDERMYEHIKRSCIATGKKRATCTKRAAATVNKYRAVHGRTKTMSCPCPRGSRPLKSSPGRCYNPRTRTKPSRAC